MTYNVCVIGQPSCIPNITNECGQRNVEVHLNYIYYTIHIYISIVCPFIYFFLSSSSPPSKLSFIIFFFHHLSLFHHLLSSSLFYHSSTTLLNFCESFEFSQQRKKKCQFCICESVLYPVSGRIDTGTTVDMMSN